MVQFIDDHRDAYGVESICTVVPIAPSTYFWHKARHADPTRRSARVQRDDEWRREMQRVWDDNQQVYGPRVALAPRIRRILSDLDAALLPGDMDIPGYRLHPLTGDRRDHYGACVSRETGASSSASWTAWQRTWT